MTDQVNESLRTDQVRYDNYGAPIKNSVYRAYEMIEAAAMRIGMNNYRAQMAAHTKAGRKKSTFRFTVTKEHQALVDALPKLLSGEINEEDAYFLVNGYECQKQRLAGDGK